MSEQQYLTIIQGPQVSYCYAALPTLMRLKKTETILGRGLGSFRFFKKKKKNSNKIAQSEFEK